VQGGGDLVALMTTHHSLGLTKMDRRGVAVA
jgi:hypothetical protein